MDGYRTRNTLEGSTRHSFFGRVVGVLALIAAAVVLYKLATVFLIIMGAIVIAVCIRLIADPLCGRLHLGTKAATAIAVAFLLCVAGAFSYFFGVEITRQLNDMFEEIPRAMESIRERMSQGAIGRAIQKILNGDGADPGAAINYTSQAIGGVFNTIFYLAAVFFGGIIFAVYPAKYRDGVLLLLPEAARSRVRNAANACGAALKGWLVGQLIAMAIIAILTSLGLLLIGMPSWLALGLLAGAAQFVPVLGPFASAAPGLLIAASISPTMMISTLAVYVVVQQLETNLITPFIMRKAASLPMALTLFAIVAMGVLFGLAGAALATPFAVIFYVLVKDLYVENDAVDASRHSEPLREAKRRP